MVLFFVLARLLTPEDIGIYSVALAVIGLAHVLRDFGVPSYLIQEKTLTQDRTRTAFTLTLIFAVVLTVLIWLGSKYVATFYNEPRLEILLQVLSTTFLLIPFSSTALALLRRDMRFDALFRIDLLGSLVNFGVALGMALAHFGLWSLVFANICTTLVTALATAYYAQGGFVHRPTVSEWRRVVSFGGQASTAHVVTEVAMRMSDLVAGKVLGLAAVALLSRAQGLMNLFHRDLMGAVKNVAYPALARAHREGADMEALHIRSTALTAAVGWPFYGFFSLYPLEALRAMFGDQWDAAAPLVPIFCFAGALAVFWMFTLQLLTAIGAVGLMMRAEIFVQLLRIAIFLACGYIFGTIESFAYGLVVVYLIQLIVVYTFKGYALPTRIKQTVRAMLHSGVVTLFALTPAIILRILLDQELIKIGMLTTLLYAFALTLLTWILTIHFLKHPLRDEPYFEILRFRVTSLLRSVDDPKN